MLAERLIPQLQERFPGRGLRVVDPPAPGEPFAVFPAVHPEFGDLALYDDGEEVTIEIGRFTHIHLADWEAETDEGEREGTVRVTIQFLDDLFADKIEVCGRHNGIGTAGPRRERASTLKVLLDALTMAKLRGIDTRRFVWSGPIHERAT
jgi:hypothetical protein